MSTKRKQKSYDNEFKAQAVKLAQEIRKNFFELDLFLNILLHIQHVHYKNLLILNINYPLFF